MTNTPGQELPSVTIDGHTYLIDSLSDKGKQLVSAMAAAQQELNRLQLQAGITQTALQAYGAALKEEVGQVASNAEPNFS
ncbi:MAG: hypothetical protein FJ060_13075 [Cyanobacteria bacterium K_Offshore_0m_m2_072]|nr:hypothetical protein [Cyanobacteria bacterium K_Offshore_0m_m2_072]